MSVEATPAWLYDGKTASRRTGQLEVNGDRLLYRDDMGEESINPGDLVHFDERGDRNTYACKNEEGWRLHILGRPSSVVGDMLPLPTRYGTWIDRLGLG